jgi:hypothetical protein
MAGSAPNAGAAKRPLRELLTGLLCALCCALPVSAWAVRPVRVYEVDLHGGQTPAALQEAMREALVRATGRRDSATDPVFANLIGSATNYVKAYTSGPHGESQVVFDNVAVEHAIAAAGRTVWERERPFTLVVLSPAPPRAVEEAARGSLEQTAMERGLPISLVPLTLTDASGNELGRDALMQVAQRYGGDAVLVGRGDPSTPSAQLEWTLYNNFSSQSWTGTLTAGIDRAADDFAPAQGEIQAEVKTVVQIDGLMTLSDFATAQRMLEALPGNHRANVVVANASSATFDLVVRGGADAIDRALTASGKFVKTGTSNGGPVYQYRSQ